MGDGMISRFGVRRGACREAGRGLSRDPQEPLDPLVTWGPA